MNFLVLFPVNFYSQVNLITKFESLLSFRCVRACVDMYTHLFANSIGDFLLVRRAQVAEVVWFSYKVGRHKVLC